jgi:hypothetical protein
LTLSGASSPAFKGAGLGAAEWVNKPLRRLNAKFRCPGSAFGKEYGREPQKRISLGITFFFIFAFISIVITRWVVEFDPRMNFVIYSGGVEAS